MLQQVILSQKPQNDSYVLMKIKLAIQSAPVYHSFIFSFLLYSNNMRHPTLNQAPTHLPGFIIHTTSVRHICHFCGDHQTLLPQRLGTTASTAIPPHTLGTDLALPPFLHPATAGALEVLTQLQAW